jgi:seryl-tRNA synthetase
MADKRDVRSEKIPPLGVRAQTAKPAHEVWDEELTPEPAPPGTVTNEDLDARARGIKHTASTTLTSVADLRKETTEQIGTVREELKADISEVRTDVKTLTTHFSDMRESVAKANGDTREALAEVKGQLNILPTLVKSIENARHVTFAAQVDVGKERAISEIHDEADERETQRKLKVTNHKIKLKFATITGSIVAIASTLITLLASRC